MAKKNHTTAYLLVGIIGLLLVAAYFGGLFSIAVGVGSSTESKYATPDQALAKCEQERIYYQGQGQTCDPCGLACPSSALDGSYTYTTYSTGQTTTVNFDPSKCSSQYTASGNLLEAKSFCHDTIRLCQKQEGTGTIEGVTQVKNGKINTVTYSYYLTNCDTGKYYGTSTLTSTIYQLECTQGFIVDGTRQSSTKTSLGVCIQPEDPAIIGPIAKAATIKSTSISSPAESGKSLRISGVVDVTGLEGNYYIHGELTQPTQTFSVITGFGFQDECGNDPLAATVIKTAKTGDQIIFSLDIVAPSVSGTTNVQGDYKVTVLSTCGGSKLATKSGQYSIIPTPVPVTTPISVPVIAEPPYTDPQTIIDEQTSVEGTTCLAGETASVQNCVVAKCTDAGVMDAIDPIICNGTEYPSPSTTIDDNGGVIDNSVQSTSLWSRFIEWLKNFFRIG